MQFLDARQEALVNKLLRLAGNDSRLLDRVIAESARRNNGKARLGEVVEKLQEARGLPRRTAAA